MPDALHQQCRDAAAAVIQALVLDGMTDRVWAQDVCNERSLSPPYVLIAYAEDPQPRQAFDSVYDELIYPLPIMWLDASQDGARSLAWRQAIDDAFRNQRLAGVPEVYWCEVIPEVAIDPELFRSAARMGGLTVRCHCLVATRTP